MKFAIKKDNFITNLIVADYDQKHSLEVALEAELIDLNECNVTIGDYWNGENWTRNVDGEQVIVDISRLNEPSQIDMIEAQVAYTAMMTDTLLEV